MAWHWVDYVIIAIIGLSVLTGLFRGFIKELVALCIWILAIWLALKYSSRLDPWLSPYISDKTIRMGVGFVAILIGTIIVGGIINTILSLILRGSGLSAMDRLLGMGFGCVRGVFIVAFIMLVIKMTSLPFERYADHSQLYRKFDPLVNWLYGYAPQLIHQVSLLDKDNLIMQLDKNDIKPGFDVKTTP